MVMVNEEKNGVPVIKLQRANRTHCLILILFSQILRYIGESVVTGSDCLWLSPVWGVPLCLLETLLDTMEGARAVPHNQGSPWAPQPHHEPSAITACTQTASLYRRGPPLAQPP